MWLTAPMSRAHPPVSANRVEGSLGDTPIDRLLESCRQHLITGRIEVRSSGDTGVIELRAGLVDRARFGEARDDDAVDRIRKLSDGSYELSQSLPDLDGSLGEGATGEGDLSRVPLVKLMRHCEDQALSCTITIVAEFDRAEIKYRVGEIVEVTWNGRSDLDAIVDLVKLTEGRFRVQAPPLPSDIDGWPSARKDPTMPFRLEHAKAKAGNGKPAAAPAAAPTPVAEPAPAPAAVAAPAPETATATETAAPAPVPSAPTPSAPTPSPFAPARARPVSEPPVRRQPSRSWDTALVAIIGLGVITFWLVLAFYVR